jgi:hypothetical protein
MARRSFLSGLLALPVLGLTAVAEEATRKQLKIMMKSAWGLMIRQSRRSHSCMGLRFRKRDTRYRYSCSARQSPSCISRWQPQSCLLVGPRWLKLLRKLPPGILRSMHAERAAVPDL